MDEHNMPVSGRRAGMGPGRTAFFPLQIEKWVKNVARILDFFGIFSKESGEALLGGRIEEHRRGWEDCWSKKQTPETRRGRTASEFACPDFLFLFSPARGGRK
jgi:hypothetical protein